jgi:hypothetical protein
MASKSFSLKEYSRIGMVYMLRSSISVDVPFCFKSTDILRAYQILENWRKSGP